MFSFKDFCEVQTDNQRYAWFNLEKRFYHHLSDEERLLVHVEDFSKEPLRLFYPPDKYWKCMPKEVIQRLLVKAVEQGDSEEIIKLKRKLNEKENT
jgi:hypothetical protein